MTTKREHCPEVWQLVDEDGPNLICDRPPGHDGAHHDPLDRLSWEPDANASPRRRDDYR